MNEPRVIEFVETGEPKPKLRPRVRGLPVSRQHLYKIFRTKSVFTAHIRPPLFQGFVQYSPADTRRYEDKVKACFLEAAHRAGGERWWPHEGPVEIEMHVFMPRPKSRPKWWQEMAATGCVRCATRPDWDNIAKVVCDSLNGCAFRDDALIADATVRMRYGAEPELRVRLTCLVPATRGRSHEKR